MCLGGMRGDCLSKVMEEMLEPEFSSVKIVLFIDFLSSL